MTVFDVVSLVTRVQIREAMTLLGRYFEYILKLSRQVLTSSCFSFAGNFYKRTDGVGTRSPPSPANANFFLDDFDEMAFDRAPHKPLCWSHYVDDTSSSSPTVRTSRGTSLTI
jgi:hypothetical protein